MDRDRKIQRISTSPTPGTASDMRKLVELVEELHSRIDDLERFNRKLLRALASLPDEPASSSGD